MIARFDNVTLKIWFSNQSTSRNIRYVYEMEYNDNIGIVKSTQGTFFINMANINLIEEVE